MSCKSFKGKRTNAFLIESSITQLLMKLTLKRIAKYSSSIRSKACHFFGMSQLSTFGSLGNGKSKYFEQLYAASWGLQILEIFKSNETFFQSLSFTNHYWVETRSYSLRFLFDVSKYFHCSVQWSSSTSKTRNVSSSAVMRINTMTELLISHPQTDNRISQIVKKKEIHFLSIILFRATKVRSTSDSC